MSPDLKCGMLYFTPFLLQQLPCWLCFQYGFLILSVFYCIPAWNLNISFENQKITMSCSCSLCHNKCGNIAFIFNLQIQPSRTLQLHFQRAAISPLTLNLTFLWIFFFPFVAVSQLLNCCLDKIYSIILGRKQG